ncbi:MAG: hypothetical protein FWJ85_00050 [Solitalea sp.]
MKEQNHPQTSPAAHPDRPNEKPPLFRSWKQMYAFILVLHALVIAVLYIFTLNYQ